jgi:hypothetical protein
VGQVSPATTAERARVVRTVAFMVLMVSADVSGGAGMVRCDDKKLNLKTHCWT